MTSLSILPLKSNVLHIFIVLWRLLLPTATTVSHAQPIEFHFTIPSEDPFIPGAVTGRILGLQNNTTNQQASAIMIDGYPAMLGGEFERGNNPVQWDSVYTNSFDVTNGAITSGFFISESRNGKHTDTYVLNVGYRISTSDRMVNNGLTLNHGQSFAGNGEGSSGTIYMCNDTKRLEFAVLQLLKRPLRRYFP